jgi:multiple sugar transport system permease protein
MRNSKIKLVIDGILIILAMIWTLLPLWWTFQTSISPEIDLTRIPPRWLPSSINFNYYKSILFKKMGTTTAFRAGIFNSSVISITVAFLSVFLGSLAAYAIVRLNVLSGQWVIFTLLFAQMIPPVILITSLYVIASKLHLLDTKILLILIYSALELPMAIWILRGYFQTIPKEIEDSALIDGCSPSQVLFRIVLPLSGPALFTTGIFTFISAWGEFLMALVFTSSLGSKTMPVAIAEFMGRFTVDYGLMCTAGMIASIPPILIALIFQRFIIQGLTSGAVKG